MCNYVLTATVCTALAIFQSPLGYAQPSTTFPSPAWERVSAEEVGLNQADLERASRYALRGDGAGYVVRFGRLVHSWGDPEQKYDLKSTSKSIGVTALGLALADGKVELHDLAIKHLPGVGQSPDQAQASAWASDVTLRHLATQTAGFDKPGGYSPLLFPPGSAWFYSDCGPNWLADCLTQVYVRDMEELLFERIFTPLGITPDDLHWRKHAYREPQLNGVPRREFGSGVHANVNAMARIGLLYLNRGRWHSRQLLPADFVDAARSQQPELLGLPEFELPSATGNANNTNARAAAHGNASDHYGLLWWNNADGSLPNVPRDAYWSWGLYDSLILVIPSLDLVVARAGKSWPRTAGAEHYAVLAPFFDSLVAAARPQSSEVAPAKPPYPASSVISGIRWAPPEAIIRLAEGSDNWPNTWADDGKLYTAYGDGWGFTPRVEKKLSLGMAIVAGHPAVGLETMNLRSDTAERVGQGSAGVKASGLLCVDSVLYMWLRNADNSQLAWSTDHGLTWQTADWKFTESFGCPTFLNAGKNYADAQDDYAYIYSFDSDSAYQPADRMVLARVKTDQIQIREAYEFFAGAGNDGNATWTSELSDRAAVFEHRGRCYRGGVTYNQPLGRYLWCQTLPESLDERGPRYEGGFGVYEAPHPWGPWNTVFFTEHWDVGPGETSSFPAPWISGDGKQVYLLFSGDDCFSIRKGSLDIQGK